jgi:ribokinase
MSAASSIEGRVLVIGDIVTDIVAAHSGSLALGSDTAATIRVTGGGSGGNTAAWLALLGLSVDLVAVAGMDVAGTDRLAELEAAGVGCSYVRRSPNAPTGSVVVLANDAERTMLCDRGANLLLEPSDVDAALGARLDVAHLHLSGYTLLDERSRPAGRHALAVARARSVTTSVDAASAAPLRRIGGAAFLEWVRGVDVLLANLAEARALLNQTDAEPAGLALALSRFARRAVVKLGSDGAVMAGDDAVRRHGPERPARVVDPTGAGDAFAAGLLASWLAGDSAEAQLRAANRMGGRAVAAVGGRPT